MVDTAHTIFTDTIWIVDTATKVDTNPTLIYIYIYIRRPLGVIWRVEVLCSPFGETRVGETLGPGGPSLPTPRAI